MRFQPLKNVIQLKIQSAMVARMARNCKERKHMIAVEVAEIYEGYMWCCVIFNVSVICESELDSRSGVADVSAVSTWSFA